MVLLSIEGQGEQMKLRMKPVLWNALDLDVERHYDLARCCFYLGRGVEETRYILSLKDDHLEVQFVLSSATLSGYDPDVDVIIKSAE